MSICGFMDFINKNLTLGYSKNAYISTKGNSCISSSSEGEYSG